MAILYLGSWRGRSLLGGGVRSCPLEIGEARIATIAIDLCGHTTYSPVNPFWRVSDPAFTLRMVRYRWEQGG